MAAPGGISTGTGTAGRVRRLHQPLQHRPRVEDARLDALRLAHPKRLPLLPRLLLRRQRLLGGGCGGGAAVQLGLLPLPLRLLEVEHASHSCCCNASTCHSSRIAGGAGSSRTALQHAADLVALAGQPGGVGDDLGFAARQRGFPLLAEPLVTTVEPAAELAEPLPLLDQLALLLGEPLLPGCHLLPLAVEGFAGGGALSLECGPLLLDRLVRLVEPLLPLLQVTGQLCLLPLQPGRPLLQPCRPPRSARLLRRRRRLDAQAVAAPCSASTRSAVGTSQVVEPSSTTPSWTGPRSR
ncbi:MAG: hypothetical protein U0736_00155 [Gemmataceae bacterium]